MHDNEDSEFNFENDDEFDSFIQRFEDELLDNAPDISLKRNDPRIVMIELILRELAKEGFNSYLLIHTYDHISETPETVDWSFGDECAIVGALYRSINK